jgi:tetratricopeptide (TPR) repeat protein
VAARLRDDTPAGLLARLSAHMLAWTEPPQGIPARQHTLEASISWSTQLLAPAVRAHFFALGALMADWDLHAAAALWGLDEADAGIVLRVLLAHSLVARVDDAGQPRYRLLEVLRVFAHTQLAASPAHADVMHAMAAHFTGVFQARWHELEGAAPASALAELDRAWPNMRAAMLWCVQHDPVQGMQGMRTTVHFVQLRGLWDDAYRIGHSLLVRASATTDAPPELVAYTHIWCALMCNLGGHAQQGAQHADAALAFALAGNDIQLRMNAWRMKGYNAQVSGDLSAAIEAYGHAHAGAIAVKDAHREAQAAYNLGWAHMLCGDHAFSELWFDRAAQQRAEIRDARGVAQSVYGHGRMFAERGDWHAARARFESAVDLLREIGDAATLGGALVWLARARWHCGAHDAVQPAIAEFRQCSTQRPDRVAEAGLRVLEAELSPTGDVDALRNLARYCTARGLSLSPHEWRVLQAAPAISPA